MGDWTFFSNHGHVLVCLAHDNEARLRDVADRVGITERAVQKIVRDLQDEGYLEISKHGRRNRYRINNRKNLRHSLQAGCTVGQLLRLVTRQARVTPEAAPVAPEPISEPTPTPEETPLSPPEIPDAPGGSAARDETAREGSTPADEPSVKQDEAREEKTDKPGETDLEQGQLF